MQGSKKAEAGGPSTPVKNEEKYGDEGAGEDDGMLLPVARMKKKKVDETGLVVDDILADTDMSQPYSSVSPVLVSVAHARQLDPEVLSTIVFSVLFSDKKVSSGFDALRCHQAVPV